MEQTVRFKTVSIALPEGVSIQLDDGVLAVKGPRGEEKRRIHPQIDVKNEDKQTTLTAKIKGKKGKTIVGTWTSHIRNMIKGVTEGHVYKLKICSSHFPMTVSVDKGQVSVKNFMGEKVARIIKVIDGVNIKVEGQDITLESASKEKAGNMASALEKLTQRVDYDKRIFQDGIYITNKDGKAII